MASGIPAITVELTCDVVCTPPGQEEHVDESTIVDGSRHVQYAGLDYDFHDVVTLKCIISVPVGLTSLHALQKLVLEQVLSSKDAREYSEVQVSGGGEPVTIQPENVCGVPSPGLAKYKIFVNDTDEVLEDIGTFVPVLVTATTSNEDVSGVVGPPDKILNWDRVSAKAFAMQGPPPVPKSSSSGFLSSEAVEILRGTVDDAWLASDGDGDDDGDCDDSSTTTTGKIAAVLKGSTRHDFRHGLTVDAAVSAVGGHDVWKALVDFLGHEPFGIIVRRTDPSQSLDPMWIPWHVDVTATWTLQVPLSSDAESDGAFVFQHPESGAICKLPRHVGFATVHRADVPHAVMPVCRGVRHSLFLLA